MKHFRGRPVWTFILFMADVLKVDSLPSNGEDMCNVQAYINITFQTSKLLLQPTTFGGRPVYIHKSFQGRYSEGR